MEPDTLTDEDLIGAVRDAYNEEYFDSYNKLSVHELMLKDRPRTLAYLNAIKNNEHIFRDKIILDVGAGTGILSLFAAKIGGAKHVYAVEASEMALSAEKVIEDNGLSDKITVIHDSVENIFHLPVQSVDVIISEWMGFYLLHESMLDSVINARDRFLAPNGIMFPSKAHIYAAPCDMSQLFADKLGFWHDVYGFNFSYFVEQAATDLLAKPYVDNLDPKNILSKPILISEIDCKIVKTSELHSIQRWGKYQVQKAGVLHGFALWFDVEFDTDDGKGQKVVLSTGPMDEPTHWKQTVILLPQTFEVTPGIEIPVHISINSDEGGNHRHYELSIEFGDE
jgi:2-polyprenyl-3-methyl-5-hydroxy-6-metoxy-1,4-benzoquinol methylase